MIDTHPGQCKVMSIREREQKCRKDDMEKPSSMDTEALLSTGGECFSEKSTGFKSKSDLGPAAL